MGDHPINRADITVVPNFITNEDLAQSICHMLNRDLKKISNNEDQPLTAHGPKFLVYRPSGRAGDEFKEHVSRHLMNQIGVKTYLIIASSTKPADQFSISKDDQDKLQDKQTKLVIDEGRLVNKNESYYHSNRTELWKLAEDIFQKYKNDQLSPQTFLGMKWRKWNPFGENTFFKGNATKSSETSRYTLDALFKALTSGKTLADNLEEETVQRMRKILEDINTNVDKKMIEIIPILQQYMDHIMGSPKKPQKEPARNQDQAPGPGAALVPAPAKAQAQAQALNPDPPVPPTDLAPSPDHDHTPIQDQYTDPASSPGYDHAPTYDPPTYPAPSPGYDHTPTHDPPTYPAPSPDYDHTPTYDPPTYPAPSPDCDHAPTHAPVTDPAPSPDFDHIKIHLQTLLLLKIMIILQLMILLYILVLL
ncbi:protein TsetseEP-like isoform X2 [Haliotis rufescens]|nr:protein TsetseEP-like isoform X2 [Haliotis rufescens]